MSWMINYGRSNVMTIPSIQICPSSGRLQLVDETGSVDVLIPDLPSTWNANSIYEVKTGMTLQPIPPLCCYKLPELDKRCSAYVSYNSQSFLSFHFILSFLAFQVTDYRVVIEGIPHLTNHFGLFDNKESVSCRSIFRSLSQARETGLVVYIYFHWGKVTCRNVPFYPSIDWKDDVKKLEGGAFHLLYVTHKFPVPHKVCTNFFLSFIATLLKKAAPK